MESDEITNFLRGTTGFVRLIRRDDPHSMIEYDVIASDARGVLMKSRDGYNTEIFLPWHEVIEVRKPKRDLHVQAACLAHRLKRCSAPAIRQQRTQQSARHPLGAGRFVVIGICH